MGSANQFGIEIQAVVSYRRRALLVGAKTHNVLALGWFRAAANF
jgi:branched-subunit amino acid ABC-type transport system permease component